MMIEARAYSGPFPTPDAGLLQGAIGWRHVSASDGPGRWKPAGYLIVFPDHVLQTDLDGIGVVDSILWAPS